ncbi:host cell factor [Venturia nashicola]|nr:host cell factor [Venturia nashicola]
MAHQHTALWTLGMTVLAGLGLCQYNPISDMCSRWDHQSVVKGDTLFIDGGLETFITNGRQGKQVIGTNTYLLQIDLSQSWDWKTNISETAVTKEPNPNTGTTPPTLLKGAMYRSISTDENVYTFGGATSQLNGSFSTNYPDPSYDITSAVPERPSRGSYAEAADQGLGFYLGGELSRGSSTRTLELGNKTYGLQGMSVLNFTDITRSKNMSTFFFADVGVVSSTLTYVPGLGDRGILVSMGGTAKSVLSPALSNGTMITFDKVNIFDVSVAYQSDPPTSGWYSQNTTGKIPSPRIDACSIMVAAPDNSSYNIYLYGGRDPVLGKMYDDIYILSLPSFTWSLGNRQMLTVGGSLNMNATSGCDWEEKGVAILDLSTKQWGSVFNAKAPAYTVTQDVVNVIGGTIKGGATMLAPVGGFSDPGLKTLFFPPQKIATPSATSVPSASPPITAKKVSGGAVAGGIIAGLACLALIAGLLLFLLRRRRQQNQANISATSGEYGHEKDGNNVHELVEEYDSAKVNSRTHLAELGHHNNYAELGAAPQYELATPVQAYELGTGRAEAKRLSEIELASSPAGDETEMRTLQESLPLPGMGGWI